MKTDSSIMVGFTYEFGSNDTDVYGVNVGVGYKF